MWLQFRREMHLVLDVVFFGMFSKRAWLQSAAVRLFVIMASMFSPVLMADNSSRSISLASDKCVVTAVFYKNSSFNHKNDSQYVYARVTAEGSDHPLSGINLNNLSLRIGDRSSTGTYVESVASVMADRYPSNDSGRVIVNIYWTFSGKVLASSDSSTWRIFALNSKKPICLL